MSLFLITTTSMAAHGALESLIVCVMTTVQYEYELVNDDDVVAGAQYI